MGILLFFLQKHSRLDVSNPACKLSKTMDGAKSSAIQGIIMVVTFVLSTETLGLKFLTITDKNLDTGKDKQHRLHFRQGKMNQHDRVHPILYGNTGCLEKLRTTRNGYSCLYMALSEVVCILKLCTNSVIYGNCSTIANYSVF